MSPLKRLFAFAKPHQNYLYLSLIFNLLYSLLNIFSVATMLPILGLMFGTMKRIDTHQAPVFSGHFSDYFIYLKNLGFYKIQHSIDQNGIMSVLATLCIVTAFAFFVRNMFRYLGGLLMVNYRIGVTRDLRTALYKKFLALPVSFFTEQKKGDMMSRISNDIGSLEASVMGAFVEVINAPFMIIVSLISLFILDYKLTLFALIVFPVMGFIISSVGKKLKRQASDAQTELGNLFSIVEETLKSSKIIKIFNADKILYNRFEHTTDQWQKHSISMSKRGQLASPMSEFLGSITILLITWYAGMQIVEEKTMQPETFLVFIALFFQLLDPAKKLSSSITSIQGGMASYDRVVEILDYDLRVEEIEHPIPISNLHSEIEFRNVKFAYENENLVVKNFNLKIPLGKSVALVGQSGSGKSTIANLITRFYDVSEGEILIDGVNIKNLNLKDYRQLLGMVTQESVLFNDSIWNNIAMGKENASESDIIEASKIANAHQFISALPNGYFTNIGDDGNKLSGGQKQRVSIARAVLKNPPIMILDEATSALDTESEKQVQIALENMMSNRTSLIIAHRLSTIQKADWIVVMERGEMMEQGTHKELMERKGIYKKLVELQNLES